MNRESRFTLINAEVEGRRSPAIDDPLEDLLNEFAHLDDADFDRDEVAGAPSIKEFISMDMLRDLDGTLLIEEQYKLIQEARKRISYYLKEIELNLP